MRTSLPLLALLLVGCSGIQSDFIYTQKQAEEANQKLEKLAAPSLQKYVAGVKLTEDDRTKLEQSIPILNQIIAYDPVTINAYAMKGKIQLALGNPQQARETYLDGIAKSLKRDTEIENTIRSDMYIDIAAMNIEQNNVADAEKALDIAIEFADTSPQAHVLLGRIYLKRGEKKAAQDEAVKALLLNADYEPARTFYQEVNGKPKASP